MHGLLLTLLLLRAAPSVEKPLAVLLVERGPAVSRKQEQALATQVSALLARELGSGLGTALVVRLEVEALADMFGLRLEAVSTPGGASLLETTFVVPANERYELEAHVTRFTGRLRALLAPAVTEPPPPGRDAPLAGPGSRLVVPRLPLPEPPAPQAPLLPPLPPAQGRRSRVLAHATGGGALVAAGAAISFGLLGLSAKQRLEGGTSLSSIPHSEASALAERANLSFTLALSSAVLSAALGTATVILWQEEAPSR